MQTLRNILFFAVSLALAPVAIAKSGLFTPPLPLPPTSYAEVNTQKVKNAKVVWMNYQMLRELGYEINASTEKTLLDQFAFIVPKPAMAPFLEGETKSFFADRYGSVGINGNLGSGRAASLGGFQVKGIGATPLVGPQADAVHSSGTLSLQEAMKEAVWSSVLSEEMPYGANKVLAVILVDDGQNTEDPARALLIREDPLRPAHFLTNFEARRLTPEEEAKRSQNALHKMRSLWNKELQLDPSTSLRQTFLTYTERLADQYAFLFANRLFHGATTPSNIMLNAGFLDFGTQTSLEGYQAVMGADLLPSGDIDVVYKYILTPVLEDIRSSLSLNEQKQLPDLAEVQKLLHARFMERRTVEMLKLTGAPAVIAENLASTPAGKNLFAAMQAIYENDRKIIYKKTKKIPPRATFLFKLNEILMIAGSDPFASREQLAQKLKPYLTPEYLEQFTNAYEEFMKNSVRAGSANAIKKESLKKFIANQSSLLNVDRKDLYASKYNRVRDFLLAGKINRSASDAQYLLDRMSDQNILLDRNLPALATTVERWSDHQMGEAIISLYDASDDSYKTLVRLHAPFREGGIQLQEKKLELNEIKNLSLAYTDANKKVHIVPGAYKNQELNFLLPNKEAEIDRTSLQIFQGDKKLLVPAMAKAGGQIVSPPNKASSGACNFFYSWLRYRK